MTRIDEVTEGIYRISQFVPQAGITYNQFLIADEHPTLIHTGWYTMYEDVHEAIAAVLDPSRLAYIIVAHFEADECGGMGRFAAQASEAILVCSEVGQRINLSR